MSVRNYCVEAATLRGALLVGLLTEADVVQWADEIVTLEPTPSPAIIDVAFMRPELSALRDALQTVAGEVDEADTFPALFALLEQHILSGTQDAKGAVRVLGQLRRFVTLPSLVAEDVKEMEERQMLAQAAMPGAVPPTQDEILDWLGRVRGATYHIVRYLNGREAAAFIAALSRLLFGPSAPDSRHGGYSGTVWRVAAEGTSAVHLILSEHAWRATQATFTPTPTGARIPYSILPPEATLVFEQQTARASGLNDIDETTLL